MGNIAICWNFDTTYLVAGNTVLCSCIGVRLCVWSGPMVLRVEGTTVLALVDCMSVPEKAGIHTGLIRYPRKGNNRSDMNGEEGERYYVHRGQSLPRPTA
jgi:hypothetical protein